MTKIALSSTAITPFQIKTESAAIVKDKRISIEGCLLPKKFSKLAHIFGPTSLVLSFFVFGIFFNQCEAVQNGEKGKNYQTTYSCGLTKKHLDRLKRQGLLQHRKNSYSLSYKDKQRIQKLRDTLESDVKSFDWFSDY